MSTILVTGGAGSIGSNVVAALLAGGERVTVLDDLSSGRKDLVDARAELIEGTVESDADVADAFRVRPDYVIHMATLFANQNSVEHPREDLAVSGMGTLKILEGSRASGVKKVLYASSSCVYGPKETMIESDPLLEPETPYAMTKLLAERYCRFWAEHHGLDAVIVRLFNTYGPGEYPGPYRNVIPNFFQLALRQRPLPITGTGEETRDFTYVSDTVAGILAALFSPTEPGEIFNIASGRDTSIIQLARLINAMTDNRAGVAYLPRRAWDRVAVRRGSIQKATAALGYSPRFDLRTGLARTHDWLRARV